MDPELKALLEKAKEAIGNQKAHQEAIDEIKAWGAEGGQIAKADAEIKKLALDLKATQEDFAKKINAAKKQAYDAAGNYRGKAFRSETAARCFALAALAATAAHGAKAMEVLKADHADYLERATGTAHAGENSLVSHEQSSDILRLVEDYGAARKLFRVMPVSAGTGTWHRRVSGFRAHKTAVRTAVAEQAGAWEPLNWSIDDYDILCSYPISLEEDMFVPFAEMLAQEMALGFAIAEDEDMLIGDGTASYDNVVGLIPRLIAINGVDNGGGLVLADGNAWSEITETNIDTCLGQARHVRSGQGKISCSNEFFWQVLQRTNTAHGGVSLREAEGGVRLQYKGTPVEISSAMPRVEGNSQVPMTYGDHSLAGTIYDRKQLTIRESREVRFESKEVVLLATERIDMDIHTLGNATTPGPVVGLITASG